MTNDQPTPEGAIARRFVGSVGTRISITTDPQEQHIDYTLGGRLIALDGEFSAADLRQIVKLMESGE